MQKVQIAPEHKLQDQEKDKHQVAAASVAAGTTVPQQPQTLMQDDGAHNVNPTTGIAQGIVPKALMSVTDPDKSCHTPWSHQERLRIMLSQAREREQQQQALMDQVEQEEAEKQNRYSFEQRQQTMHQEWQSNVDTATAIDTAIATATAHASYPDSPDLSFSVDSGNTGIEVTGDTTAVDDASDTSADLSSGEDALGALLAGLGNSVAVRAITSPDEADALGGSAAEGVEAVEDASAYGLIVDHASGDLTDAA